LYTYNVVEGLRHIRCKSGLVVVYPKDLSKPTPLFCPICEYIMRSRSDSQYYEKFNCCYECGMKWAEIDQESWSQGNRPSKKEVSDEIKKRKSIPISFYF